MSVEELKNVSVDELGEYLENASIIKKGSGKEFVEDIIGSIKRFKKF